VVPALSRLTEACRADFLGDHIKPGEHRIAELGRDRDIGSIPAASNENPSNSRDVVR